MLSNLRANKQYWLGVAIALLVTPVLLSLVIGGNLGSDNVLPWMVWNVAPVTTIAVLGWVSLDRIAIPRGWQGPWWKRVLRVLAWLLIAPPVMALVIGGDFWTILTIFRGGIYMLGGCGVALLVYMAYQKAWKHRGLFHGLPRFATVLALLILAVGAQVVLFIPVAAAYVRWQQEYCEAIIVPRIEAYKAEHRSIPRNLREVLPAPFIIPPDVQYESGMLVVQDRGDLLDDWAYQTKGAWVEI